MFVTCLYDIYNKPEKMAEYIKLFTPLALSDLTIHLYTSNDLAYHFKNYPSNIKVFIVPLKHLDFYNLFEIKMECPSCYDYFDGETRIPRNLCCGHTFCEVCLIKIE